MWRNLTCFNALVQLLSWDDQGFTTQCSRPLGEGMTLQMFVDSDYADDNVSQCSRTGFVIFVNHGVIDCLSKKQSMVEDPVFEAKLCTIQHGCKTCMEYATSIA